MDQIALVKEQIQDGWKLIERLTREGFPVSAACWGKEEDDEQWYLYLVSPIVDGEGIRNAYLRVHAVIREMQKSGFAIDPFAVKLLGPSEPLARSVLEEQGRKWPARHRERGLGSPGLDVAHVYPARATAGGE